jgi:hypothetical protein
LLGNHFVKYLRKQHLREVRERQRERESEGERKEREG